MEHQAVDNFVLTRWNWPDRKAWGVLITAGEVGDHRTEPAARNHPGGVLAKISLDPIAALA